MLISQAAIDPGKRAPPTIGLVPRRLHQTQEPNHKVEDYTLNEVSAIVAFHHNKRCPQARRVYSQRAGELLTA